MDGHVSKNSAIQYKEFIMSLEACKKERFVTLNFWNRGSYNKQMFIFIISVTILLSADIVLVFCMQSQTHAEFRLQPYITLVNHTLCECDCAFCCWDRKIDHPIIRN